MCLRTYFCFQFFDEDNLINRTARKESKTRFEKPTQQVEMYFHKHLIATSIHSSTSPSIIERSNSRLSTNKTIRFCNKKSIIL